MDTPMTITNMYQPEQTHVHEFLGSTHFAEEGESRHNHRFAGVTGEVIPLGNGKHAHNYKSNTDFFEEHHHMISGRTGPDIKLPNGNHVHYEDSFTTVNDDHRHEFEFVTLLVPRPNHTEC